MTNKRYQEISSLEKSFRNSSKELKNLIDKCDTLLKSPEKPDDYQSIVDEIADKIQLSKVP